MAFVELNSRKLIPAHDLQTSMPVSIRFENAEVVCIAFYREDGELVGLEKSWFEL